MLFNSRFSRKIITFVLCIAVSPLFAHSPQQKTQQQMAQVLSEIAQSVENQRVAQVVLSSMPNQYSSMERIISDVEWSELQLDRLVAVLERTETSFGSTGLKWLLYPIKDLNEIRRRQTIVRSLVQDQKLFNNLQASLQKVKKGETAVLTYWKQHYQLHQDAQIFDYTFPKLEQYLNKNELALEGGSWFTLGRAGWALAGQLCLTGIFRELTHSRVGEPFTLAKAWNGFKSGLRQPFNFVNPKLDMWKLSEFSNRNAQNESIPKPVQELSRGNYGGLILSGSAGDRYKCIYDLYRESLGETGAKVIAWGMVGTFAALYGAMYYMAARDAWNWFNKTKDTSNKLHISLTDVASLIRSIGEVEKVVSQAQVLRSCKMQQHFQKVTNKKKRSKNLQELINLLESRTFNEGGTLLHRRGRVLKAHKLLQAVKGELIPALQAIAEFDAYLSLAKLVKEREKNTNHFTFATFAIQQEPLIDLDNGWIDGKMIASDHVVSNSTKFGVNNQPTKLVITGPNGGGKSTYLKSLGQAVCMAQGWGIVAAQKAHMTLFTGLRTSLDPKEDMSRGISTFMAQKERIKSIEDFMAQNQPHDKYLIMLDEPYRGTTDDESAHRIWQFGERVAQMPHCVTLIATHVKKPIKLVQDTKGVFANFQVEIDEVQEGQFKRTFKIKPGAAMWWFEDSGRRSRFVDWLDDEIKCQAQRRSVAA